MYIYIYAYVNFVIIYGFKINLKGGVTFEEFTGNR